MRKISLDSYLKEKNEELARVEGEVDFLERIDFPAKILVYSSGEVELFSDDYSLATNFKIKKRNQHLDVGFQGYDGGSDSVRVETYPQFYFNLSSRSLTKPIYIEHDGFYEDKRVVINSVVKTSAWGKLSSESGFKNETIDFEKVFSFFRERGVSDGLLNRLSRRIELTKEF